MADSLPFQFVIAQINPIVGDIAGNAKRVLSILTAHNDAEKIVVFPELVLSGYPPEDLILKPSFLDCIDTYVAQILEASTGFECAFILPAPYRDGSQTYNATHLIYNGKVIGTALKHHLPNYGVFDEKRVFASGDLRGPIEFKGHKIGLMICEDMWFEDVAAYLKSHGAEIFVVPHGSPYCLGKKEERMSHAAARARDNNVPLIFVNQIGGQDELVFDGSSFAVNDAGNIVHQAASFEEDICAIDLNAPAISTPDHENKDIYDALVLGLHDYVTKNGFSSVLLGLSGGVDSALVATIAADALGAENVRAVMLPSRFTSQASLDDAAALANNLGISLETISIAEPLSGFENALRNPVGITHENLQSRIRGSILMALSNESGAMLLTTGNKSEMACGYATLYGDMNGGFNPIKDLYKTRVYEICAWRNLRGAVIPENILTKAPSAELREDQTDQDSLPEYDILDGILHGLIEEQLGLDDLIARGFDRKTILHVWKLLDRTEYKRFQSAPGTKITPLAFGRNRRYPMTNGFIKTVEKNT